MIPLKTKRRAGARLAVVGLIAVIAGALAPAPAHADDAPSFRLLLSGDYYEQDYSFWVSPGQDKGPQPGYFIFNVAEWGDGFSDGTDVSLKMTSSNPLISLVFDGGSACTVEGDATVCNVDDYVSGEDQLWAAVAASISPEFEMADAWLDVAITLSQGDKSSTYESSVEVPLISTDWPSALPEVEFENGALYPDNPWVERPQKAELNIDVTHLPSSVVQPAEISIDFNFGEQETVLDTTDDRCTVNRAWSGDTIQCVFTGVSEGDLLSVPFSVDNVTSDRSGTTWGVGFEVADAKDNDPWRWYSGDWPVDIVESEDWAQYPAESIGLTDVEPGFSGALEGPRFNATGEQSIPGLVIEMGNFPGDAIALTAEYDNCVQEEDGVSIICVVPGFDPVAGETYHISADTPIGIEVAETAAGPYTYSGKTWISYDQQTWVADEYPELFKSSYENPLVVEPAVEDWTPESDDPLAGGLIDVTTTENNYDLEPTDVDITGAVGDTVTVDFTVTNDSGADAAGADVRLQLPTGVKLAGDAGATEAADSALCMPPQELSSDDLLGELVCEVGEIEAGSERKVSIEVEITGDVESSDGWVEVAEIPISSGDEESLESDRANNSASVHFKPAKPGGGADLPKTGASLTVVIGTAAAVVAAGIVLMVLLRRRRPVTAWQ